MEPESSLPHSQVPATYLCEWFVACGVVSTSPKPQAAGLPLDGRPRLRIQHIRS